MLHLQQRITHPSPSKLQMSAFVLQPGFAMSLFFVFKRATGVGKQKPLSGIAMPDHELISELQDSGYDVDESGHDIEHSIENQLPDLV